MWQLLGPVNNSKLLIEFVVCEEVIPMKRILHLSACLTLALFVGLSGMSVASAAEFETTSHVVTVSVPQVLSISADTSAIALTFSDFSTGSETDQQTVVYTVSSNNMGQADGATAINANLDFLYDRIDFQAQVGAYTKVSGNTELAPAQAGFVSIGTSNVAIANKANSTLGSDGRILNGSIPVTYKAVATDDVISGDQIHSLFVTLTTI